MVVEPVLEGLIQIKEVVGVVVEREGLAQTAAERPEVMAATQLFKVQHRAIVQVVAEPRAATYTRKAAMLSSVVAEEVEAVNETVPLKPKKVEVLCLRLAEVAVGDVPRALAVMEVLGRLILPAAGEQVQQVLWVTLGRRGQAGTLVLVMAVVGD